MLGCDGRKQGGSIAFGIPHYSWIILSIAPILIPTTTVSTFAHLSISYLIRLYGNDIYEVMPMINYRMTISLIGEW